MTTQPDGYTVAWGRDLASLMAEVNAKIERGYLPIGGMSNYPDTGPKGGYIFCQAMALKTLGAN